MEINCLWNWQIFSEIVELNMFKEKENYYLIEEFKKYGITAVYTKKIMGNMSDYCPMEGQREVTQRENRRRLLEQIGLLGRQEVMAFQTHSANVHVIGEKTDRYYYNKEEDIDGFITKRRDVTIFTFYADCLPIFVYDRKKKVIGVWHSGWPGTYKEIMKNGLKTMKEYYDTDPTDVIMALGIGIQPENYEVGNEFYENFSQKFGSDSRLIGESFIINNKTGKYHFDNTRFNEIMALSLGIKRENLIVSREDTWNEKFYSHRREGTKAGRATAAIAFE